jgi:hypothetical protein
MNVQSSGRKPPSALQRGQAIVIIALGFIMLLGFMGLVVDVARVFVARGSLRRAIDSAGLAAAAQFRQNATTDDIKKAAEQFIYAHGIVADTQTFYDMSVVTSTLSIETCDTALPYPDSTLCTHPLKRKLVRIRADADVSMTFLQILGVQTTRVRAETLSEAAAVDVVLVIDASKAQASDPPSKWAYTGLEEDKDYGCGRSGFSSDQDYVDYQNACIKACNDDLTKPCYPFKRVKDAAIDFIDQLYQDYDRVAVIKIDRELNPQDLVVFPLSLDLAAAKTAIAGIRASDHSPGYAAGTVCPYRDTGQSWRCTTANTGGALWAAGAQFGLPPTRDDSLWVVILVGSSGADVTPAIADAPGDIATFGLCPGNPYPNQWVEPYCRDNTWSTHYISTEVEYDAEDYAYDKALYLGLDPGKVVTDRVPNGGLGVLMFAIGLGQKVVCTGEPIANYNAGPPATCVHTLAEDGTDPNPNPYIDPVTGYPNVAESFLRYVAFIGSTNDPTDSDPCEGKGLGVQCGNYYFAPTPTELQDIFLAIAGKIFTRLSG